MQNSRNLKILIEKFIRDAINPNFKVFPENKVPEQIGNEIWVKMNMSILTSRRISLNFNDKRGTGSISISIYIPIDSGSKKAYEVSDEIANALENCPTLESEDGNLLIEFSEGVTQTPSIKENNYYKQVVNLLFSFTRSN